MSLRCGCVPQQCTVIYHQAANWYAWSQVSTCRHGRGRAVKMSTQLDGRATYVVQRTPAGINWTTPADQPHHTQSAAADHRTTHLVSIIIDAFLCPQAENANTEWATWCMWVMKDHRYRLLHGWCSDATADQLIISHRLKRWLRNCWIYRS